LNEGNASFFQKKYYPTLRESFISLEEFKNQKKFQSSKKMEGGDYFWKTRRA
jgi:hypothetical protein